MEEFQIKFHSVSENEVTKVVLNHGWKKTPHPIVNIPAGILKVCVDSYISILPRILNTSLETGCFPNQLELAEVTSVFKKEDELSKENYRLVSVLSHESKIFEGVVFKFLPLLTEFSKNHSTQNALLNMIEKLKHALDRQKGW